MEPLRVEPYRELSRSIAGRTAIVTGAASGMGRATAHLFAREGARVAVTDLKQDDCQRVVGEIEEAGFDTARAWALDVSDPRAIEEVVADVVRHFGGLDIVVNNAGIVRPAHVQDESYEESWRVSLEVMLTSHQRMVRAALPHLRKSDAARIVNVASTEALGATPGSSTYATAKHGVVGLTRGLAVDLGKEGITVNCICPGPIRTGLTDPIPEEHKAIYARRRVPLGRYGIPEEVANVTLSIVLPASSFLTGAVIVVDGGFSIRN